MGWRREKLKTYLAKDRERQVITAWEKSEEVSDGNNTAVASHTHKKKLPQKPTKQKTHHKS